MAAMGGVGARCRRAPVIRIIERMNWAWLGIAFSREKWPVTKQRGILPTSNRTRTGAREAPPWRGIIWWSGGRHRERFR